MNIHEQFERELSEHKEERKDYNKQKKKTDKLRRNLYQSFKGIYKKQGYEWTEKAQAKYRKIAEEKYPRVIHSDN